MSSKSRSAVQQIVESPTGQAGIAFAVGGLSLYLIGYFIALTPALGFIIERLSFRPVHAAWLDYGFGQLAGIILMALILGAAAGAVVSLVMRQFGLARSWLVTREVLIWSAIGTVVGFLALAYIMTAGDHYFASTAGRTIEVYLTVLIIGLPFNFAWYWANRPRLTRKHKTS